MSPKYETTKSPSTNGYRRKGKRYSTSRSRSRTYSESRSRSRSYSGSYSRSRSHSRDRRRPYRSRSRGRGRVAGPKYPDEIVPCSCIGVFGLSLYTRERDLKEIFSKYGTVEDVVIVYDHNSRRSRGFGFVYFSTTEEATRAKDKSAGLEIDGRLIRVDYSVTQRAHTPTPGIYMGKPAYSAGYSRKRTPSPYYSGRKRSYSRSRSRSYSYGGNIQT